METGNVKVTDLSTTQTEPIQHHLDPNLVKVEVSYPKSYEGAKFFQDGSTAWVSPETAAILVEKGIATEQKRSKDEKPESNDVQLDADKVTGTNAVHVAEEKATASTVGTPKTNKNTKS